MTWAFLISASRCVRSCGPAIMTRWMGHPWRVKNRYTDLRNRQYRLLHSLGSLWGNSLLPGRHVGPVGGNFELVSKRRHRVRTRATKDSLMREVTIVLFPTPSTRPLSHQYVEEWTNATHHHQLEGFGHPSHIPLLPISKCERGAPRSGFKFIGLYERLFGLNRRQVASGQ